MIKEILKSLILFILVVTSVILTILVWRFEAEFSEVDTSISPLPNTGQGEVVEIENIIRPYQFVLIDGSEIIGTQSSVMSPDVRNVFAEASINGLQIGNDLSMLDSVLEDIDTEKVLLMDYPTGVPIRTLLSTLNLNYDGHLSDDYINRIIFNLRDDQVGLYLLNKEDARATRIETDVNSNQILGIIEAHEANMYKYSSIITNRNNASRLTSIYSPSEPVPLSREVYISSVTSVDLLNQVLFLNKNYEMSSEDRVNIYQTDHATAYYNNETFRYLYQNDNEEETPATVSHHVVMNSFNFLNSQRALSRNALFFDYHNENSEVIFRDTLNGLFIFSDALTNTTIVRYGDSAVFEYQRSLLKVNTQITSQEAVQLQNIESVRYEIARNDRYNLQNVTNFVIGYNMRFAEEQSELNLITYTPAWFIEYEGVWMRYEEGELNG